MKIAFFGCYGAFDHFKIGGTESFARRLATGLIGQGHRADFVAYGAPLPHKSLLASGIGIYYHTGLRAAFHSLQESYDHVITMYMRPRDRLPYLYFRKSNRQRLAFHQVYFSWPDSRIKREAAFLDARLYPFNGRLFCISPRIYRKVSGWSNRGVLLLPPVPEDFFLDPTSKPAHDKTRVIYIGRTDPGKGIEDAIELFTRLKDHPDLELEIHGYHGPQRSSVRIHQWLSEQKELRYFHSQYESYSPEVEQNVRRILRDTDILILPYRKLSSTIDTPLLLLEAMASLCAVVTRPMGDIPLIYGSSPFLLSRSGGIKDAIPSFLQALNSLRHEQERIFHQNKKLAFKDKDLTGLLINYLS